MSARADASKNSAAFLYVQSKYNAYMRRDA
jgi:hypothetical protein